MHKQLRRSRSTHNLKRREIKDRSSDNTVTVVATATVLVGRGVGRASILEDDAVAVVARTAVLVGGNVGGWKNNAVEGIHVECVGYWLCSLLQCELRELTRDMVSFIGFLMSCVIYAANLILYCENHCDHQERRTARIGTIDSENENNQLDEVAG